MRSLNSTIEELKPIENGGTLTETIPCEAKKEKND
nr:MAG TPA: hypothetical protein [Bacteriophage sp.]